MTRQIEIERFSLISTKPFCEVLAAIKFIVIAGCRGRIGLLGVVVLPALNDTIGDPISSRRFSSGYAYRRAPRCEGNRTALLCRAAQ
jgi:hypothetical protein